MNWLLVRSRNAPRKWWDIGDDQVRLWIPNKLDMMRNDSPIHENLTFWPVWLGWNVVQFRDFEAIWCGGISNDAEAVFALKAKPQMLLSHSSKHKEPSRNPAATSCQALNQSSTVTVLPAAVPVITFGPDEVLPRGGFRCSGLGETQVEGQIPVLGVWEGPRFTWQQHVRLDALLTLTYVL